MEISLSGRSDRRRRFAKKLLRRAFIPRPFRGEDEEELMGRMSRSKRRKLIRRFLVPPGLRFRGEDDDVELMGKKSKSKRKRIARALLFPGLPVNLIAKRIRARKRKKAARSEPDISTVSMAPASVVQNIPSPEEVTQDTSIPESDSPEMVQDVIPVEPKKNNTKTIVIAGLAIAAGYVAYKASKK